MIHGLCYWLWMIFHQNKGCFISFDPHFVLFLSLLYSMMKKILNRYFWRATSNLSIKKIVFNSYELWGRTTSIKIFKKIWSMHFLFFSIKTELFSILWISLLISWWFDLILKKTDSLCNSLQNLTKTSSSKE